MEAKEFLRQRCVGREVLVKMEYVRKIGGEGGDNDDVSRVLEFGGVYLPGEKGSEKEGESLDVAEMLVLRGLPSVTRHRETRSARQRYDDLVAAEQRAAKAKKGIQNRDKEAPTHHVNDISQNAQKARQFLPFLQRAGKSHGVVDYVVNGHRAKISIPKESAVISFALAGVRCPQGPRGDAPGEPFAAEALRHARRRCMQRDVEIEVDAVDKTGAFSAACGSSNPAAAASTSARDAPQGLGSIHPMFVPERHPGGEILRDAQEAAGARAGRVEGLVPEAEAAKAAAAAAGRRRRVLGRAGGDARAHPHGGDRRRDVLRAAFGRRGRRRTSPRGAPETNPVGFERRRAPPNAAPSSPRDSPATTSGIARRCANARDRARPFASSTSITVTPRRSPRIDFDRWIRACRWRLRRRRRGCVA